MIVSMDLRDSIVAAMASVEHNEDEGADRFMKAFSAAMIKYLQNNTDILYSWVAANPAGTPDPLTTFKCNLRYPNARISSRKNLWIWLDLMSDELRKSLIVPELQVPPFALPPLSFPNKAVAPTRITVQAMDMEQADSHVQAIGIVSEAVVDYIKKLIDPTPVTGSRGPFIGTATMISIT